MLAAPGQPVRVPTQGLTGWLGAARSQGGGLASVLKGSADLYEAREAEAQREQEQQQVARTGELAAFSDRLKAIAAELREDLQEQPVQDWDDAWERAAAPLLAEAVDELPAGTRASGLALARAYSAHASIEARRDRDLQRVEAARRQWQQRVDEAVAAGQGEQAAQWLETGRGVFVPEAELPARRQEARSRAQQQGWEARLQAAPLETLADFAEQAERRARGGAQDEGEPRRGAEDEAGMRAEEQRAVEQAAARARRRLQQELAQQWSQSLREGQDIAPATLALARRAKLLPVATGVAAGEGTPSPAPTSAAPTAGTLTAWRRWLDERAEGAEPEAAARLALAAAPLPLEARCGLLLHLDRTAQVAAADRRSLSRGLFSLFREGAFGCPADTLAQRALLDLQDEAAALLADEGAEGAAAWLDARRAAADKWICYEAASPQVRGKR